MISPNRLRELAGAKGYGFNHYKHPLGEPAKVVLIGERHAVHQDYAFQSSLIELLKPKVVMHEFYKPNGTASKSDTVRMAVDQIHRWKREYKVELKPCDLPNRKIHQFEQLVYGFLGKLEECKDESELESILVDDNAIREMIMGKLIRAEAAKSDKPLIAVVGGYHARPESRIHEELRCERAIEIGGRRPIGYVTINQDDRLARILERGTQFFE